MSNFQCKDEGDLFSRCFEYPAHACHVTFVMLAELLPDVGAKAGSNMAWSFEDSRSSAGTGDLAALLHSRKVEARRGRQQVLAADLEA